MLKVVGIQLEDMLHKKLNFPSPTLCHFIDRITRCICLFYRIYKDKNPEAKVRRVIRLSEDRRFHKEGRLVRKSPIPSILTLMYSKSASIHCFYLSFLKVSLYILIPLLEIIT